MVHRVKLAIAAIAGAALLAGAPAAAQLYSDGYKFLKAVEEKKDAEVNELLQKNATLIDARDVTSGRTALHIAAENREYTWLSYLLGKGANPNIADKRGVTPLMLASQIGFVEAVNALAQSGAKVDTPNNTGETPLISAVHRRDVAMLRVLLLAGADPDRADNSGRSARDYAALMGPGSQLLAEIERLANSSSGAKSQQTYGPKF
ncbi:ankyrin repeat domain-containing protein [Altererythrobacter soli]|uniref:Ankyrin repeat domain-containing protein n=1 Tax=Croceibacterium soli TaxID=1739690 RepID=A0A6I4UXN7_9SPHN|nr:ankyrin repeat domain-containing protein [Croceibacterium soli]MXP42107.1 ankyrin repeat domain-containing protein [Croceibacterium soli]